jgi:hypothetical protein
VILPPIRWNWIVGNVLMQCKTMKMYNYLYDRTSSKNSGLRGTLVKVDGIEFLGNLVSAGIILRANFLYQLYMVLAVNRSYILVLSFPRLKEHTPG